MMSLTPVSARLTVRRTVGVRSSIFCLSVSVDSTDQNDRAMGVTTT